MSYPNEDIEYCPTRANIDWSNIQFTDYSKSVAVADFSNIKYFEPSDSEADPEEDQGEEEEDGRQGAGASGEKGENGDQRSPPPQSPLSKKARQKAKKKAKAAAKAVKADEDDGEASKDAEPPNSPPVEEDEDERPSGKKGKGKNKKAKKTAKKNSKAASNSRSLPQDEASGSTKSPAPDGKGDEVVPEQPVASPPSVDTKAENPDPAPSTDPAPVEEPVPEPPKEEPASNPGQEPEPEIKDNIPPAAPAGDIAKDEDPAPVSDQAAVVETNSEPPQDEPVPEKLDGSPPAPIEQTPENVESPALPSESGSAQNSELLQESVPDAQCSDSLPTAVDEVVEDGTLEGSTVPPPEDQGEQLASDSVQDPASGEAQEVQVVEIPKDEISPPLQDQTESPVVSDNETPPPEPSVPLEKETSGSSTPTAELQGDQNKDESISLMPSETVGDSKDDSQPAPESSNEIKDDIAPMVPIEETPKEPDSLELPLQEEKSKDESASVVLDSSPGPSPVVTQDENPSTQSSETVVNSKDESQPASEPDISKNIEESSLGEPEAATNTIEEKIQSSPQDESGNLDGSDSSPSVPVPLEQEEAAQEDVSTNEPQSSSIQGDGDGPAQLPEDSSSPPNPEPQLVSDSSNTQEDGEEPVQLQDDSGSSQELIEQPVSETSGLQNESGQIPDISGGSLTLQPLTPSEPSLPDAETLLPSAEAEAAETEGSSQELQRPSSPLGDTGSGDLADPSEPPNAISGDLGHTQGVVSGDQPDQPGESQSSGDGISPDGEPTSSDPSPSGDTNENPDVHSESNLDSAPIASDDTQGIILGDQPGESQLSGDGISPDSDPTASDSSPSGDSNESPEVHSESILDSAPIASGDTPADDAEPTSPPSPDESKPDDEIVEPESPSTKQVRFADDAEVITASPAPPQDGDSPSDTSSTDHENLPKEGMDESPTEEPSSIEGSTSTEEPPQSEIITEQIGDSAQSDGDGSIPQSGDDTAEKTLPDNSTSDTPVQDIPTSSEDTSEVPPLEKPEDPPAQDNSASIVVDSPSDAMDQSQQLGEDDAPLDEAGSGSNEVGTGGNEESPSDIADDNSSSQRQLPPDVVEKDLLPVEASQSDSSTQPQLPLDITENDPAPPSDSSVDLKESVPTQEQADESQNSENDKIQEPGDTLSSHDSQDLGNIVEPGQNEPSTEVADDSLASNEDVPATDQTEPDGTLSSPDDPKQVGLSPGQPEDLQSTQDVEQKELPGESAPVESSGDAENSVPSPEQVDKSPSEEDESQEKPDDPSLSQDSHETSQEVDQQEAPAEPASMESSLDTSGNGTGPEQLDSSSSIEKDNQNLQNPPETEQNEPALDPVSTGSSLETSENVPSTEQADGSPSLERSESKADANLEKEVVDKDASSSPLDETPSQPQQSELDNEESTSKDIPSVDDESKSPETLEGADSKSIIEPSAPENNDQKEGLNDTTDAAVESSKPEETASPPTVVDKDLPLEDDESKDTLGPIPSAEKAAEKPDKGEDHSVLHLHDTPGVGGKFVSNPIDGRLLVDELVDEGAVTTNTTEDSETVPASATVHPRASSDEEEGGVEISSRTGSQVEIPEVLGDREQTETTDQEGDYGSTSTQPAQGTITSRPFVEIHVQSDSSLNEESQSPLPLHVHSSEADVVEQLDDTNHLGGSTSREAGTPKDTLVEEVLVEGDIKEEAKDGGALVKDDGPSFIRTQSNHVDLQLPQTNDLERDIPFGSQDAQDTHSQDSQQGQHTHYTQESPYQIAIQVDDNLNAVIEPIEEKLLEKERSTEDIVTPGLDETPSQPNEYIAVQETSLGDEEVFVAEDQNATTEETAQNEQLSSSPLEGSMDLTQDVAAVQPPDEQNLEIDVTSDPSPQETQVVSDKVGFEQANIEPILEGVQEPRETTDPARGSPNVTPIMSAESQGSVDLPGSLSESDENLSLEHSPSVAPIDSMISSKEVGFSKESEDASSPESGFGGTSDNLASTSLESQNVEETRQDHDAISAPRPDDQPLAAIIISAGLEDEPSSSEQNIQDDGLAQPRGLDEPSSNDDQAQVPDDLIRVQDDEHKSRRSSVNIAPEEVHQLHEVEQTGRSELGKSRSENQPPNDQETPEIVLVQAPGTEESPHIEEVPLEDASGLDDVLLPKQSISESLLPEDQEKATLPESELTGNSAEVTQNKLHISEPDIDQMSPSQQDDVAQKDLTQLPPSPSDVDVNTGSAEALNQTDAQSSENIDQVDTSQDPVDDNEPAVSARSLDNDEELLASQSTNVPEQNAEAHEPARESADDTDRDQLQSDSEAISENTQPLPHSQIDQWEAGHEESDASRNALGAPLDKSVYDASTEFETKITNHSPIPEDIHSENISQTLNSLHDIQNEHPPSVVPDHSPLQDDETLPSIESIVPEVTVREGPESVPSEPAVTELQPSPLDNPDTPYASQDQGLDVIIEDSHEPPLSMHQNNPVSDLNPADGRLPPAILPPVSQEEPLVESVPAGSPTLGSGPAPEGLVELPEPVVGDSPIADAEQPTLHSADMDASGGDLEQSETETRIRRDSVLLRATDYDKGSAPLSEDERITSQVPETDILHTRTEEIPQEDNSQMPPIPEGSAEPIISASIIEPETRDISESGLEPLSQEPGKDSPAAMNDALASDEQPLSVSPELPIVAIQDATIGVPSEPGSRSPVREHNVGIEHGKDVPHEPLEAVAISSPSSLEDASVDPRANMDSESNGKSIRGVDDHILEPEASGIEPAQTHLSIDSSPEKDPVTVAERVVLKPDSDDIDRGQTSSQLNPSEDGQELNPNDLSDDIPETEELLEPLDSKLLETPSAETQAGLVHEITSMEQAPDIIRKQDHQPFKDLNIEQQDSPGVSASAAEGIKELQLEDTNSEATVDVDSQGQTVQSDASSLPARPVEFSLEDLQAEPDVTPPPVENVRELISTVLETFNDADGLQPADNEASVPGPPADSSKQVELETGVKSPDSLAEQQALASSELNQPIGEPSREQEVIPESPIIPSEEIFSSEHDSLFQEDESMPRRVAALDTPANALLQGGGTALSSADDPGQHEQDFVIEPPRDIVIDEDITTKPLQVETEDYSEAPKAPATDESPSQADDVKSISPAELDSPHAIDEHIPLSESFTLVDKPLVVDHGVSDGDSQQRPGMPRIDSGTQTDDLFRPKTPLQNLMRAALSQEFRAPTPAIEVPDPEDPHAKQMSRARSVKRQRRQTIRDAEELVAAAVVIYATAEALSPPGSPPLASNLDKDLKKEEEPVILSLSDSTAQGVVVGDSTGEEDALRKSVADLLAEDKSRESKSEDKASKSTHSSRRSSHHSSRSTRSREGGKDATVKVPHHHHHHKRRADSENSARSGSEQGSPRTPKRQDSGFSSSHSNRSKKERSPEEQAAHDKRKEERRLVREKERLKDSSPSKSPSKSSKGKEPDADKSSSHRSSRRHSHASATVTKEGSPAPPKKFFDMKNGQSVMASNFGPGVDKEIARPDLPQRSNTTRSAKAGVRKSVDASRAKLQKARDEVAAEAKEATAGESADAGPGESPAAGDEHRKNRQEKRQKESGKDHSKPGIRAAIKRFFTS